MALISKEDLLTKFETGALLFQPEVKRIIKIQPEVDAEPVRHGRWEVIFYDNIPKIAKCSECGEALFFTKEDYPIRHISSYCPNCGAKMDEEEQDVTLN